MYEENSKKSLFSVIFSAIFFAVFIFIMSSYIIRCSKMSDADIADDVMFNDITIAAYEKSPKDFKVLTYDLEKRFEAVEKNQLLQLEYLYYIPKTEQMQLTIKYNTSYANVATDTSLPFILTLKNEAGEVINDFFYQYDEKDGYGYIRVCWNGVKFTAESEHTLRIEQEKDGETVSRGLFLIQKSTTASKEIKLTEKNAPYIFLNG